MREDRQLSSNRKAGKSDILISIDTRTYILSRREALGSVRTTISWRVLYLLRSYGKQDDETNIAVFLLKALEASSKGINIVKAMRMYKTSIGVCYAPHSVHGESKRCYMRSRYAFSQGFGEIRPNWAC